MNRVKVFKYNEDIIFEKAYTMSPDENGNPKEISGIRMVHIPTRMAFESFTGDVDLDKLQCKKALNEYLFLMETK